MPKLAEALIQRKDLQARFNRLCIRLKSSARVQEGDQPAEQPAELVAEARRVLDELKRLITQINRTNAQTPMPGDDTGSIMDAIAERDRLRDEREMLEQLGQAARIEPTHMYGATRNEVKWRPTVDQADIQRQIDALSERYRLLDTRIQEANWLVDLLQN